MALSWSVVDDAQASEMRRSFALGSILRVATAAGVASAAVAAAVEAFGLASGLCHRSCLDDDPLC